MVDINFLTRTVLSGLSALVVEDVVDGGDVVVVTARTRDAAVPCPVCQTPTGKVHGYHGRTVTDVPVDARVTVGTARGLLRRNVPRGCGHGPFEEPTCLRPFVACLVAGTVAIFANSGGTWALLLAMGLLGAWGRGRGGRGTGVREWCHRPEASRVCCFCGWTTEAGVLR
ncbi:hypothetical protein GCM10023084_81100 [Streptomyces lacrimifluminis]|uniref:Transposase n=1 Tax=Streptomyces lacrimifluminis TaxID=1500077 RepID=A0A917PBC7_9ACTN|nr:hypothetical protein GCM10012282_78340 [Streptomyces lacrimifluminis]